MPTPPLHPAAPRSGPEPAFASPGTFKAEQSAAQRAVGLPAHQAPEHCASSVLPARLLRPGTCRTEAPQGPAAPELGGAVSGAGLQAGGLWPRPGAGS